jgi:hypothetical protein
LLCTRLPHPQSQTFLCKLLECSKTLLYWSLCTFSNLECFQIDWLQMFSLVASSSFFTISLYFVSQYCHLLCWRQTESTISQEVTVWRVDGDSHKTLMLLDDLSCGCNALYIVAG